MLHYNIGWLGLVALLGQLPVGPLTQSERTALDLRLQAQTVEVRRVVPPPPNIIVPGGTPPVLARGWLAANGRVVTASLVVEGWPSGPDDRLEVRHSPGDWVPAMVGLMDARIGLAVLDVELPSPPRKMAENRALGAGRQLFVAGAGQPVDTRIGLQAAPPLEYYWTVLGPTLVLGTPLFDHRGELVSLIGAPGPLALPGMALEALWARELDWRP